jgi:uncharacterized protein with von Willebrand factor type A (vWA) domain
MEPYARALVALLEGAVGSRTEAFVFATRLTRLTVALATRGPQAARWPACNVSPTWVNPRSAAYGYAPLAGGMAAAMLYCDAFLSGHSVAALDDVLDAIGAPQ